MKNLKIFYLVTLAVVAGLFSACSDSDFEPGPGVDGAQIYFPENIATDYSISDDISSIAIPVKRIVTEEAMSIAIMAEDESGLFTIPSTVNFAAGQASADLLITFDRTELVDGTTYPISFLINDENNKTPYGYNRLSITISPWPWESLGTGKFRDDWFTTAYNGENPNPEIEVTIHQHKSKKGVYMIENMYGWPFLTEFFAGTQEEIEADGFDCTYTPTNITINCSDPNAVTLPLQNSGLVNTDPSLGTFQIATYKATPGTLVNGVITFPKNGIAFVFADGANQLQANASGLFRIILPGYEATDYSLSATYDGMRVSADAETASAVIDFGYGADVTGISYVFAPGDVTAEADEYAAKIVDGTAEDIATVEQLTVGGKSVSIEAELPNAGGYTIIAVPHDKNKQLLAKEVAATAFYFPGLGGNTNPVDVAAALYKVTEYPDAAEFVDQCPDYSSILFEISGTELTTVKTYINKTAVIESAPSMGMTLQQIMDQYGRALAASALTELNETGKYWNISINLDSDESYTLLVEATNAYGKKKLISTEPFSTEPIPYAGDLVVGQYTMSYTTPQGQTFNNLFKVKATLNSLTKLEVADIGLTGDGSVWEAAYDQTANTLTLSGVIVGEEARGNMFGKITTYYDAEETQAYGFFSYASESSEGNDPLVLAVDPASRQLSAMKTDLEVPLVGVDAEGNVTGVEGVLGMYYADGTVVAPYTGNASSAAAPQARPMRQYSKRVNVPFSSVRVPIASRFKSVATTIGRSASGFDSGNGLRTLSVKSAKCEPLPRQTGFRAILRTDLNAPIREVMK